MQIELVMPRLSDSMEVGTIVRWLVTEGQSVRRGQPIAEIETDKATMEYEAESEGVVVRLLIAAGESAALGAPIAVIDSESAAPGAKASARTSRQVRTMTPPSQGAAAANAGAHGATRTNASPVARRLARDLGVDLASIRGSGPNGRIGKRDVELAVELPTNSTPPPSQGEKEAGANAKGEPTLIQLTRVQQTVARRMAEAKATVPHFELTIEIDMGECLRLREELKGVSQPDSPCPSVNDMIVKACGRALSEHPRANGSYRDGRFELFPRVNVGIAVASEDALLVPTVFDADSKSLAQIARTSARLIERVRTGAIEPPELSGATFTVSNLGMFGILAFNPVINPPQGAILATGEVRTRAHWDHAVERFVPREVMLATLACDHRILYGADAARFLARIRELLERPLALTQ
jgi:pyruvate dehydrogenase E2 component (dihydrolipoamide acetyltransferase)